MPRGGYRPGAGRKRKNANVAEHLQALARQAITDDAWLKLFKTLASRATYDTASAALLLRYALGVNFSADPKPPVVDVANTDPASPQPPADSGPRPGKPIDASTHET